MIKLGSLGAIAEDDQVGMCRVAAEAAARGNPAAEGLAAKCTELRRINIAAGRLLVDVMPVDATMRVFLADTGNRIIAGEAALRARVAKLAPDQARGFAIGIKVARAVGGLNPVYAAKVRATLSAPMAQGFDLATGTGGVKSAAPTGGLDTETIGLAAAAAVALGAVAYFFLRKKR